MPHIHEILDTRVKYLFGPLFCSLLIADLNSLNSTPVNFGRGNNSKGYKLKKKTKQKPVCLNYFFCGDELENVENTKYAKLKFEITGEKTIVRGLIA